ncbi:PREDICTED: asparagine--tRNA ligase, chloroplastic/mitochondrial-like isoform X2 [Tarenaya hassleriana]|uniref:asparagine--tRNA ligase, chloroplastic/mitochondrial-like isoform X2 n=1 Tax=Tarenaya hassleriana TaxID=28532 RepID=UPI00053C916B|nr:PREDICTED: asparagine--tRNA ligase, chloroplastic/mitochondrial-like isoform X2 [Tarenaya hassleriana]
MQCVMNSDAQGYDQIGKCDASYLIQKKRISREFLRTKAHLRQEQTLLGRSQELGMLWRILHTCSFRETGSSGCRVRSSQLRTVKEQSLGFRV